MATSIDLESRETTPATPRESLALSLANISIHGQHSRLSNVPWIREPSVGTVLGTRTRWKLKYPPQGPPDLVHWSRHYGERSSKFSNHEFSLPNSTPPKHDDGYVGHYHFVHGVDYTAGIAAIEEYVYSAIGLVQRDGELFFLPGVSLGTYTLSHQMVVTFCTYNAFAKADVQARFVANVPKSRKLPVSVSAQYLVTDILLDKQTALGGSKGEKSAAFWTELAISSHARLVSDTDDPGNCPAGTVILEGMMGDLSKRKHLAELCVAILPRGYMTGSRAMFGILTAHGRDALKTSHYRNRVVDLLARLATSHREVAGFLIEKVREVHGDQFDVVVCQLLRAHPVNHDQEFLQLIRKHLEKDLRLTHAALLLVEQCKFLLSRNSLRLAREVSARAAELLPLDFDCWFHLALAHVMLRDAPRALQAINLLPVVLGLRNEGVDEVPDLFLEIYAERAKVGKLPTLRVFEDFFPPPQFSGDRHFDPDRSSEVSPIPGMVASIWYGEFRARAAARHPICGRFYLLPFTGATPLEISAIDSQIVKVCSPSSPRQILASQSQGSSALIIDFDRRSTWGRAYDLVTFLVAVFGWDGLVTVKSKVFRKKTIETSKNETFVLRNASFIPEAEPWLDQLLFCVYDDIKALISISSETQDRSALSWQMIGLVGWHSKFNLRDSVLSLVTSVVGVAADGGFDYFGTVKLLEIYNEFVLSDAEISTIDVYSCPYDRRLFTNKLILLLVLPKVYKEFVAQLTSGFLTLELVLFHVMKLHSWNMRWYGQFPSFLVQNTIAKLCAIHDAAYIRTTVQIVFETNKKQPPKKLGVFQSMFASPQAEKVYDFQENDTILEAMDQLIDVWA